MSNRRKMGKLTVGTSVRRGKYTGDLRRRRRALRILLALLLLAVLAGGGLGIFQAGKALAAQAAPRRIIVRNCWLSTTEDVLAALKYRNGSTIAGLSAKAREVNAGGQGWLRRVSVQQTGLGTVMIEVEERCPLLAVHLGNYAYWLCDDGQLVAVTGTASAGGKLDHLQDLPRVLLEVLPRDYTVLMEQLLLAAACLAEVLPGRIESITVDGNGEFSLRERDGLLILLGEPERLPEKIGALPKALRISGEHSDKLTCLDARNPHVFYEEWRESISK